MVLNFKGLASIQGGFKIFELVLVVVTFLVARTTKDSSSLPPSFGAYPDLPWLGMGTLVSWLIILPATIMGVILGDSIAWRSDSLLSLVGGCLFLASGISCIDYNSGALGDKWDIATALDSLAIVTGIVLFVDAIVVI